MKSKASFVIIYLFLAIYSTSCAQKVKEIATNMENQTVNQNLQIATFGTGCFWCTEAVFERLKGVNKVISGYSGGAVKNPTYKEVCTGNTGHAEVCQVYFDSTVISYNELLDVFWHTHDPTTLNRQGNDIGTQYRSVIFYHSEEQKKLAEESMKKMNESGTFQNPIVTKISPFINLYKAEDYHQDYFANNPNQPYCTFVVAPKVKKFTGKYQDKLK